MTTPLPPRPPVVLDARVVSGTGGGPDKTILNSPRFLAPLGYRMLCAYLHPPADPGFEQLRRKAALWHAPLIAIPDRGAWDLAVIPHLLNVCRRERVAIWHGHDYKSNLLGLLLRPFWPMRLVTTVHGWVKHTRRTPLYYWVDRLCLPRYEKVICVSPDLVEESLRCGTAAARCVLLENAIDTDEYRRRQPVAEAKRRLGFNAGRFLIGGVGRLSAEKGFDVLVRAVRRLIRQGHNLELILVGEGDQYEPLRALIAELGCADRVRLLGYRADTRDLYEAMDAFALSSLREGLPNVVLEAMAVTVPVVATRIAGVPRLVRDGENGLLVEPGDEAGLADALARLVTDAALQERLARAERQTIEQGYSFQVRMQRLKAMYDDLLCPPEALKRQRRAVNNP